MNNDEVHPNDRNALEYQLSIMRKMRKDSFEVYMDNKEITLDEALERCVRESCTYMPDYVLDEKGNLKQVRFDRIDL